MHHKTADEMLAAWDSGQTIWSIELGGLGPGYEQAIQVAAVEFSRAGKNMPRNGDARNDLAAFREICKTTLHNIDEALGGLSGAQFSAAEWLAWQWCHNGGPEELQNRAKKEAKEGQQIQVSKFFPNAGEAKPDSSG